MIDIYDEGTYAEEVIKHGITKNYWRDVRILTKYYRSKGVKKSVALGNIKNMCAKELDMYVFFDDINKTFESVWKSKNPLRCIQSVSISQQALDWFLGLQDEKYDYEELKKKRPTLTIKEQVMTPKRIKMLFTLYIWSKIQANYLEKPNVHYIHNKKQFLNACDLPSSFKFSEERNLLYDLGFVHINYGLGIECNFMQQLEDGNDIVLSGEDLYRPGFWLDKQIYGSFVCQNCGKEFAHYNHSKQEQGRKYCKQCAKHPYLGRKLASGDAKQTRDGIKRYCVDCGSELVLLAKGDYRTIRCPTCQAKRTEKNRKKARKKYNDKIKEGMAHD